MDTRGRSRSKTPFTGVEEFSKEFIEKESLTEKTIIRSTRSTTYRTEESSTKSTDEVTSVIDKPIRKSTRSERSFRNLYKTSDYSSEDGENEVSSTKSISQNDKNQLIEDARAAANGSSEVSALDLYKRSGRYWDIYPKTDWTYSPHSRDRVELAPGVVAMPNMSRKTIHSVHSEDSLFADFAHKETNTEAYLRQQQEYRPRQLFNNNHEYETRKKVSYTYSQWLRIRRTLVTVITSFVSVCHFFLRVQTSWFAKLHQFTSRVMLLDTWLLWKNGNSNKTAKLMALCLVPLLLLGGWYILTNLGAIFYATYFNFSSIAIPPPETIIHHHPSMLIDPPNDKMAEENPKLSDEQLKVITDSLKTSMSDRDRYNVEEIVASVMQSSGFQEIVQKLDAAPSINNQQTIIDTLVEELHKLKEHMAQLDKNRLEDLHTISQLKAQNLQNTAHLSYHLTKCCRRPIINVESYVKKLLSDILNDADFLRNQKGFNDYLQAVFAAKQDLEAKLSNLTAHLSSKFDRAIEESSLKLMEEVSKKVTSFIKSSSYSLASGSDNSSFSDERAREIVRSVLKIYDADKTGLVDYAMETMGGQVLSTRCTETYHYGKAVVSVLGIPLWYPVNSPRTIITPSINPGECWAFQNFPGFVVLRLSKKVQVEAFSLEHISRLLVPNGDIDSAPKEFQVFGLKDEEDKEPLLLGEYVFDVEGEPLQFFEVQNGGGVFEIVELRVLSNNGNPNYTCLYRFRVHGKCIT